MLGGFGISRVLFGISSVRLCWLRLVCINIVLAGVAGVPGAWWPPLISGALNSTYIGAPGALSLH